MRKILVIGACGSGKSTLARRLGARWDFPVIHLDAHYWRPKWVEPDKREWEATVDALIARDRWIIDGNYSGTLARRIAAADAVVFLDLPAIQCVAGVLARWYRDRGTTRADMAPGCTEKFPSWELVRWIWSYPTRSRPKVMAQLDAIRGSKRVEILQSRTAIDRFAEVGFSELDRTSSRGGGTTRRGTRA